MSKFQGGGGIGGIRNEGWDDAKRDTGGGGNISDTGGGALRHELKRGGGGNAPVYVRI